MNHIYRLVFNRALGVRQVVPECAKAGRGSTGGGAVARYVLWMALSAAASSAFGAGGAGGNVDFLDLFGEFMLAEGGAGGTAAAPDGGNGATSQGFGGAGGGGGGVSLSDGLGGRGGSGGGAGSTGPGGHGGGGGNFGRVLSGSDVVGHSEGSAAENGSRSSVPIGVGYYFGTAPAGGGGGEGGGGVLLRLGTATPSTVRGSASATGGAGGRGGDGVPGDFPNGSSAGHGGDGGSGITSTGSGRLNIEAGAVLRAGAGGGGGNGGEGPGFSDYLGGRGGRGGAGGAGLSMASQTAVSNAGTITGGEGGNGGAGGDGYGGRDGAHGTSGGSGGRGGIGVSAASDATIENTGNITGGAGGRGGLGGLVVTAVNPPPRRAAPSGAGGAGIESSGATITNSGTITGGLSGDGATRASAIRFTGGGNTLTLRSGSTIIGAVEIANPATTATIHAGASGVRLDDGFILGGAATVNTGGHQMEIAGPITGAGSFTKTGAGTLGLSGVNTYSGGTTISGGTIAISADGNLGASGSSVTFDGGALQNTAALRTSRDVLIESAGATFRTDADLTMDGRLSGTGAWTKSGAGTLTLTALSPSNASLGATTIAEGTVRTGGVNTLASSSAMTIARGATLDLAGNSQTVASFAGAGALRLGSATLTAGNNRSTAFSGVISGVDGHLVKTGSGTLTLTGANTYTGSTLVSQGTLRAGAANTFSMASAHTVAAGASLDLAGHSQSVAALANRGTVSLVGTSPGTTLTVTGPYAGNNGMLRLGAALGGSSSASDRLVLSGPSAIASGRTTVQVINRGGLGASTAGNGIEVVSALNGATTTAQTTKDAFSLAGGHVDAGAYEYRLHAADAGGAGENWYLRSTTTMVIAPPVAPDTPADPVAPADPAVPAAPPSAPPLRVEVPTYRAEVPLFAALPEQLRQGNLAMLGNLHRRTGDGLQGERRAWGRVISTEKNIRQSGTVQPRSDGRQSGFQAGTDLFADSNWRAGVHVGQLDGNMHVSGFASGIYNKQVGSNDLRSRFLGGYATWRNDGGFYADAVLQAGQHRYTAQPLGGASTRGKGSSVLASLEVVQAFALAEGWQIEPQLQLVHQRMSLDDASIAGARVQQDSDKGWLVRAGVRVKGEVATGAGRLQPYGRLNLYRASSGTDVTRFASPAAATGIASSTGGTAAELAGGFTLALGESTSLYGELGKQWASGGQTRVRSSVQGSLGLRIKW